ncbi:YybH family protein [Arenimonas terrae]|uniref:Nuclear transport factor 2 family protein n=1 Tax=Arenimonas terrae TaxID=2546226 RepID=A0A5C4RQP6_9GAMM|nr:nuclear transport factor 2 family protein [Arenimonas terrae]TNJ33432.1 nuclear transport factor 2 family protein [Arenimonas terrae]
MIRRLSILLSCLLMAACASTPPTPPAPPVDVAALTRDVTAAETAFAQTMADRDFAAFGALIAEDAIFVNGRNPLRGKAAILADWKRFFDGPAPFSWKPETVVVLDDGSLAQTKGPVFDPAGKPILEFRSTWRREPDGRWLIIFDDGACRCADKSAAD